MSNINKDILLSVISKEAIPSSELKIVYDWKTPDVTPDFSSLDIANIISQKNLVFNSLNSISDHVVDYNTLSISTKPMPGFSIGNQNNILEHNESGSFLGEDVLYIPNTKSITDWTVFFDMEITVSPNKNKSTILLTNKTQVTDEDGWLIGINGAGFLFFRYKNINGNQSIKTFIKPISPKSIIAVSKSNLANSLSIYIYDPVLNKAYEQSFVIEETLSLKNWTIAGTFDHFASDTRYERFVGEIKNFILFSSYLGKEKASEVFESFFITEFTAEHTEDVPTQFRNPGTYAEIEVADGVEIKEYVDKEVQITTNSGATITAYEKVPIFGAKMVKETQYVNGVGYVTKMIPTIISESKTKDSALALTHGQNKGILLNETVDISKYLEIYSCDEHFGNTDNIATFMSGDSSFNLDKVYEDLDTIQIYLNGLLLEKDVDYEISEKKITKLQNDKFVESDTMIYDIYEAHKTYFDFYGYNGDIYLYGESGKDVYLNGGKLISGLDYEDYDAFYIKIMAAGLPSGRIGVVGRYSNITQMQNITGKLFHTTNYAINNEIVWLDGKKVLKGNEYNLTNLNDLNNSEHFAPQKTTKIYNNEEGNFTYS